MVPPYTLRLDFALFVVPASSKAIRPLTRAWIFIGSPDTRRPKHNGSRATTADRPTLDAARCLSNHIDVGQT